MRNGLSHHAYRVLCVTSVAMLAAFLTGCAHDGNAIGSVTVSTPVFTPITDDDRTKLDFGTFKSISALLQSRSAANLSAASVLVEQSQVAAGLALAGPTIDRSATSVRKTSDGKVTEDTTTQTSTVAQKTPDVPDVAKTPDNPGLDQQKALLSAGKFIPSLPPDDLATLVANDYATITGLEGFFDQTQSIVYGDGTYRWLPYRAQFAVSANPGWYTADRDYDAVVEICFGGENPEIADKLRIVSVLPSESAQLIDDFQASLQAYMLALSVSGRAGIAAAQGDFKKIHSLAEQIQGRRLNTKLIVTYLSSNKLRIRFRPDLTAERNNLHDLQPKTQLMTAIVWVKTKLDIERENPHPSTSQATQPPPYFSNFDINEFQLLDSKTALRRGVLSKLDVAAKKPLDSSKDETTDEVELEDKSKAFDLDVCYLGLFAPGPRDDGMSKIFLPLKDVYYSQQTWSKQHNRCQPQRISAIVPKWKDKPDKPLQVGFLQGSYAQVNGKPTVSIAYELKAKQPPDKVSISVGSSELRPTTEPSGIPHVIEPVVINSKPSNTGIINVNVAPLEPGVHQLQLPLRFVTETYGKNKEVIDRQSVVQVLTVVVPEPQTANSGVSIDANGVRARNLPVNSTQLKITSQVPK